jgi:predicted dehydrogenase
LRVGVIGLGVIGREQIAAFAKLPDVEVIGGYDSDGPRCEVVCRELGIRAFRTPDELAGDASLSIVTICTPEALHVQPTVIAIEAGKHVLIEKPIASSHEDGIVLVKAAASTDKVVMVGQTLRFDPYYVAAKKLLDDGAVGRVVHVSTRRNNSVTNGIRAGGRTTVSLFLGVHDLDFCMWALTSRLSRVCALGADGILRRQYGFDVADTVLGTVEFESGVVGGVEFSWCLPLEGVDVLDAHFEVLGETGQLLLHRQQGSLRIAGRGLQRATEISISDVTGLAPDSSGLELEIAAFVEAVRTGSGAPVGVVEGYDAMVAALALDESSRKRQPISPSYWSAVGAGQLGFGDAS